MKTLLAMALFALAPLAWGHEHHAPHGGTLVEIGEEFAHIELVLDGQEGSLTAYVLDGEAENPVRIAQKALKLKIREGKGPLRALTLKAVADPLTGETVGDTSEFALRLPSLRKLKAFDGYVEGATIRGQYYKRLDFKGVHEASQKEK